MTPPTDVEKLNDDQMAKVLAEIIASGRELSSDQRDRVLMTLRVFWGFSDG
ncbi:MAG: hypothetical protein O7G84_01005 [Gammaproteobacteria bacterium]|nr:hypothetical protein [Gammaproteobacteria bacterium]